jgi:hypothetical protein
MFAQDGDPLRERMTEVRDRISELPARLAVVRRARGQSPLKHTRAPAAKE